MTKLVPRMLLLALLLAASACCGLFQSDEDKFKHEMECALRVTDERSLFILKRGNFCCEKLPEAVATLPEARRFYLRRAFNLRPADLSTVMQMARSYWDDRNFKEGSAWYAKARTLAPSSYAPLVGEFTMLRCQKAWDEAGKLVGDLRARGGAEALKTSDYLEGRLLYDEGKTAEARPLFENALNRAASLGETLGDSPYTLRDTHLYLAQIKRKAGDAQGAYEDFKVYLQKSSDPDFQLFYKYWYDKIGSDQAAFYDEIEQEWAWPRQ